MPTESITNDSVVEGSRITDHRWHVVARPDMDCYDLYLLRYETSSNPEHEWSESFYYAQDDNGVWRWHHFIPFSEIRPAYQFPGIVVNVMATSGLVIHTTAMADDLEKSITTIMRAIKDKSGADS